MKPRKVFPHMAMTLEQPETRNNHTHTLVVMFIIAMARKDPSQMGIGGRIFYLWSLAVKRQQK
jgi:hypothetical protein